MGTSNLAWLRAICPDERFRDGEGAAQLIRRMFGLLDDENTRWFHYGTAAAVAAENGDFERAVELQRACITRARGTVSDDELDDARRLIQLYVTDRPARQVPD